MALFKFWNSGDYGNSELAAGRSPHEQIGQFRNMMMHILKGRHTWVALPKNTSIKESE